MSDVTLTEADKRTALKLFNPGMPPFDVPEATVDAEQRHNMAGLFLILRTDLGEVVFDFIITAQILAFVVESIETTFVLGVSDVDFIVTGEN